MIMESSQEYDDLLSLFDEKTQRKIKTAIWGFSLFIVWIIVMAKFNFVNLIFGLKGVGQTMASKIVSKIQINK